jgi:hypothetical protein
MPLATAGTDTGITAETLENPPVAASAGVNKVAILVTITVESFFYLSSFNVSYMMKFNVEIPAES